MKFLEFHFNPKLKKKDAVFDTFCFAPQIKKEENLGYLYLIGELKNLLPKNRDLLNKLATIIQREYYKSPERSGNDSFRESLAKVNEFLAEEVRKENVSWLGNLNMAIISLREDFLLNIAKVGNLKILLLRGGEIFDIVGDIQGATSSEKTFANIVEGKLNKGDKLFSLTPAVFEIFQTQEIFQKLIEIKKIKNIKKILKQKRKVLKEIFGACLIIIPEKKGILAKKLYFPKTKIPKIPFISKSLVSLKNLISLEGLKEKILPQSPILQQKIKKSMIALLILAILLLLGWLIFR